MKKTLSFASLVVLMLVATSVRAQLTAPAGGGSLTQPVPTLQSALPDKTTPTLSPDAMIFDGPIDPKEYRMGPGDILQYRSWTSNDASQLMVSADQVLTIPRIGPFLTKGKTLAEVQAEVTKVIEKDFHHQGDRPLFTLSLIQPRRVMVTVLGQVEIPGVYTYTAGTRATLAVAVANREVQHSTVIGDQSFELQQEKEKREIDRLKPYIGDAATKRASIRNIIVTHPDGTSERIDLLRFNATHDPRFSPLLREGDVIYVPYKKILEGSIGVYGSVKQPGDFEFVQGDSLWSIIKAAFGPSDGADLSRVELVRMDQLGGIASTTVIDCNAIKAGTAPDIALEPGDRIFVRDHPDTRELSRVILKGEVKYPGVYPITRMNTKLSDVIKEAGGFTQYAFLPGGTITRQRLDIDNKDITPEDEAKIVGRLADLQVEDTANFRRLTEVRQNYVAVDMERLFNKGDQNQDVILRDGDVISIPTSPNSVYVWGYVGSNGYIPYKAGEKVSYYIKNAGGYAEGAVEDGTRIIKARTRQYMRPQDTEIEAGDEIYVPQEQLFPAGYSLQKTGIIVGLVSGVVGTILSAVTVILLLRNH